MAGFTSYRTYNFIDKDPVIDQIRTLLKDEGLLKKLETVHELSGVSTTTLKNWFDGETRAPQYRTIAAVITSLGYKPAFEKTKDIDIGRELKAAKAWHDKQEAARNEAERRVKRSPRRQQHPEQRARA